VFVTKIWRTRNGTAKGSDENDDEGLGLNGDEDRSRGNIELQPRYPIQREK
jgi:hypothetical protein